PLFFARRTWMRGSHLDGLPLPGGIDQVPSVNCHTAIYHIWAGSNSRWTSTASNPDPPNGCITVRHLPDSC
ncbi:MAG: hypothetical protein ABIJ65_03185, partial [Chloroflexota bacterium]